MTPNRAESEPITRSQFHQGFEALRNSIDAAYLALSNKIDSFHASITSQLKTLPAFISDQTAALERRFDRLEASLTRLAHKNRPPAQSGPLEETSTNSH